MSSANSTLYKYMVSGVIEAGIFEDGGPECHAEIPEMHHYAFMALVPLFNLALFARHRHLLLEEAEAKEPSKAERRIGLTVLLSYLLTFYYKFKTRRGLFILNPCHMSALFLSYLLLSRSSRANRVVYHIWCGWLFGAVMALVFPHLAGIDEFEVLLYYYEHLAIAPVGYLILSRRYGFLRPTLKNQGVIFCSVVLYQCLLLAPLSRATMVNLNFSLCHSPADGLFPYYGVYYFVVCSFGLNFISYVMRWICYLQVQFFKSLPPVFGKELPIEPKASLKQQQ